MPRIPKKDLLIERLRRSGPGGQHRNRKATGIRIHHLPTGMIVTATERRSQSGNLKIAMIRIRERLAKAAKRRKPRKRTRPPKKVSEERLKQKKNRSKLKKLRRPVLENEKRG